VLVGQEPSAESASALAERIRGEQHGRLGSPFVVRQDVTPLAARSTGV
jgi:hypothetical protein